MPGSTAEAATAAAPAPDIDARAVGRAMSWAGVGHAVSQLWWFASLVVLAALLPPGALGAVAAGTVIVNVAALFVGSGTRGSIITTPEVTAQELRYALVLNLGAGAGITLVVAALAGPISTAVLHGADPAVLRWLILSIGMYAATVVPLSLLHKYLRFRSEAIVVSVATLLASVTAIGLALSGAGVWALVVRQVLCAALTAAFAWTAARDVLPTWREMIGGWRRPARGRGRHARWFFSLGVLTLVAMSADYVVVGRLADATQLGLYSLAFTLGFAPLTNFSWRLGMVLLPAAAATPDPEVLARRTLAAVRVMALLLLPLVPPAVILAPLVLPWALGERWAPMVVPFQILLPTGVVLALLNVVGESLAGSGNVDLHAKLHLVWAVLIVPALVVLVRADGIRGAAIAHVVVLVPLTAGYLLLGSRRLGLGLTGLFPAVRDVVGAVAAQALASAACLALLSAASVGTGVARCVAASAGLALALAALARLSDAVTEARTLVRAAVART